MKRRALAPEQALGKAVAHYLALTLDPEIVFATAINPIPAKSKAAAGLSKALGMAAGTPDWLIVYQGRAHFLELKAMSGTYTDSQREMFPRLRRLGIPLATCRSLTEVDLALDSFGIPHRRVTYLDVPARKVAA
jgi:hypothetical protein